MCMCVIFCTDLFYDFYHFNVLMCAYYVIIRVVCRLSLTISFMTHGFFNCLYSGLPDPTPTQAPASTPADL